MMEWGPLILTFKLASVTTILLFLISIPIAYWLSNTNAKIKPFIEALITLPLVLPPTVLGYYLLVAFNSNSALGIFLESFLGLRLLFSFEGLVVASIIYSLPFMVQPIQAGLNNLPSSLKEASQSLGKSAITTLVKVMLPNIKPALLTGCVLAFAHTVGEFGVVLMIGGNIPDKTRVASIAIYNEVESLNYSSANFYSATLLIVTFVIVLMVYLVNGGYFKRTAQ
jgi:molybdate transport system permease protein